MWRNVVSIKIAVVPAFVFTSAALIVTAIYSEKKKKKLHRKAKMKNQFKQEMLLSQLETQESSFNQINAELNDNIGQLLSTTKLLLGMTAMELNQPPDTLKTAEQTLARAILDLRLLSKTFNNGWLDHFNFIEHLHAEKNRLNALKIAEIELLSDYEKLPLEPDADSILFRAVQQVLENIIKNGCAGHICIHIKNKKSFLEISVEFDGSTCIKNESATATDKDIERRIKLLKGEIERKPGAQGNAFIIIKIPINAQI